MTTIHDDWYDPVNQYTLTDCEELIEYVRVSPMYTHIPYDIFVDDCQSYVMNDHQPLLFVRNGVGRGCDSFIPFSVSEHPLILDRSMEIRIPIEVISAVREFIIARRQLLMALTDHKVSHIEFFDTLRQ